MDSSVTLHFIICLYIISLRLIEIFFFSWCNNNDLNQLVLQYPVRPADITYDNIPHIGARIKPDQQKVSEKA